MVSTEERLRITYRIHHPDPQGVVDAIRVEQTIEFPYRLAPEWIQRQVVGRIDGAEVDGSTGVFTVSYDPGVVGGGLVQLLNVLWGNVSLFEGVRVESLELPRSVVDQLPGPRYGVAGLRRHIGAGVRPLLTTALKPMGLAPDDLADDAGVLAGAGFDIIKDDHGLSDQPWARWGERVRRCADAVHEANARYGTQAVYAPSLNVPAPEVVDRAHQARELGAGALLVLPGLVGFDLMRALAADDELALPIMSHPSMLGSTVVNPGQGIRHGIVFGMLCRLAGADISIFPNYGGRFSFSEAECGDIRDECLAPIHGVAATYPAPGGGMTLARVPELLEFYGRDVALLVGGALHDGDLAENARALRAAVDAAEVVG